MNGKPRDCVIVASEKADFIADRIAAGLPAPEAEMRKLARYLRDFAAEMARPRMGGGTVSHASKTFQATRRDSAQ